MKIRQQQPPIEKPSGHDSSSSAAPSAKAAKSAANFSSGQVLSGRVLAIETDGRVVLDINGRSVTAFSAVRLPLGEKIDLVVSRGGDTPWLTLKNEGPAQQLFRLLVTEALGQIAAMLDPESGEALAAPQAGQSQGLAALALLFSNIQVEASPSLDHLLFSLLNFSATKSNKSSDPFFPQQKELLQLLAQLENSNPQSDAGPLRQLLSMQQAFLSFNQQIGDKLLLIAPLFFAGNSGWGEWLVRPEKDGQANQTGEGTPLRFDFFLQLANLGETQLSLLVREHRLNGTFFLEDAAKVEYITMRLHELRDKLAKLGFEIPIFNCRIKEKNNQLRLKEILEENQNIPKLSLIDLTA